VHRDEHIDPAPLRGAARHHCLDRLVVMDIDLDPKALPPDASISTTSKRSTP
jgi:hypothetical protein